MGIRQKSRFRLGRQPSDVLGGRNPEARVRGGVISIRRRPRLERGNSTTLPVNGFGVLPGKYRGPGDHQESRTRLARHRRRLV